MPASCGSPTARWACSSSASRTPTGCCSRASRSPITAPAERALVSVSLTRSRRRRRRCMARVSMTVNGVRYDQDVEPRLLLVHFLRDTLGLTGTHIGCDTSNCGACTVHLNGDAVKSCTVLAVQADDAQVTTIEGMGSEDDLHPLQEAFWKHHGLQCGYCTPGMIMAATDLLRRTPDPTEEQVRHGLEGNLCRCTGYHNIVKAVLDAAATMQSGSAAPPAPPPGAEENVE